MSPTEIPVLGYHAHIYFNLDDESHEIARRIKASLEELKNPALDIEAIIPRPIGPHPTPMFEVAFSPAEMEWMTEWLRKNRSGLTVLIHQVTGYDLRDHLEGALWLGEPVRLDYSRLSPDPS